MDSGDSAGRDARQLVRASNVRTPGKTVCLLTANHLCHNPRVLKEATTLAQAGFAVEVLGAWVDPALKSRDLDLLAEAPFRFSPVIDLTESTLSASVGRLTHRLRGKSAQLAFRLGVPTERQLSPAIAALGAAARRQKADLYIAHSEAGLVAARALIKSGCRVGVDMEDWYSEDLLPAARKSRPIPLLRELESTALRQGASATCPSAAMGEALATAYGCAPLTTIYNAFRWSDRDALDRQLYDRRDRRTPSLHWYSQTLGAGRGLEDLMLALPHLDAPIEIHLRGEPAAGFQQWLAAHTPAAWRNRIVVHGLVPNNRLLSRIAEHDIGFAGEMKYCRNRDLTVTNKILEYLLAGLAVVASDTVGQREVSASAPGAVSLYPSGDPAALAAAINALLDSPARLSDAKAAALRAAADTFSWERQEPLLVQTISRAIETAVELPSYPRSL